MRTSVNPLLALCALVCAAHLATLLVGIGAFWHADELMQYIEQPYLVLHGLPLSAWEFQSGTRNWLFPGAILGLLGAADFIGITNPLVLLVLLRVVTKVIFLVAWYRVALVTRENCTGAGPTAFLPLALVGAFPVLLFASNHTLSEVWSLSLLFWGAGEWLGALTGKPSNSRYAGALLGLAVLVRLQTAVILPPLLLLGWWLRRHRGATRILLNTAAHGLLVLAAGGMLDAVTYGTFAHSLTANLAAHFGDDGRLFALMGTSPWHYFVTEPFIQAPVAAATTWLLFLAGVWRAPRSPVAWSVLFFVAVHSAIPHKELRFMLPALPFALLVAGEGLVWLVSVVGHRWGRFGAQATVALCVVLMAPVGMRLAGMDEADSAATQLLSEIAEFPGKPVLVTLTPGRNVWPAQSRFVVGFQTRTVTAATMDNLAPHCQPVESDAPLFLFGPEVEVSARLVSLQAAGCDPQPVAAGGGWRIVRLR